MGNPPQHASAIQPSSEIKLQSELHGAGIGLYVGDSAETTAGLMHGIGFSVRARRQTETGIRQPEILVIQRVE
jgi:hypothetical protein